MLAGHCGDGRVRREAFRKETSSGVDKHGKPLSPGTLRMSRKGNDLARHYLWNAARSAIRCNPAIRALYRRLKAKGTRGDVAMGHCMRKLLHLVFAVWKTNRPFNDQHFPWEQPVPPTPPRLRHRQTRAPYQPATTRPWATNGTCPRKKWSTMAASTVAPTPAPVKPLAPSTPLTHPECQVERGEPPISPSEARTQRSPRFRGSVPDLDRGRHVQQVAEHHLRLGRGLTPAHAAAGLRARTAGLPAAGQRERVGVGAFGAVWRARDTLLARVVALKIPHASLLSSAADLKRFHSEARDRYGPAKGQVGRRHAAAGLRYRSQKLQAPYQRRRSGP
jgi:hypothetical protein